eukprot:TRINITY_DN6656_c0_g2_i4.p1 TRINITY_DN6656_c0_g2~~TRINITY_DN6656_c0_g2_i4.p1  ORF type:complete len:224 (-),score=49.79 TRINITY_DN6656_c0_g2_i4:45-680(-)
MVLYKARCWYFQRKFMNFVDFSNKLKKRINSNKGWLIVSYILLFAVIAIKIEIQCYLLKENYDDFSSSTIIIIAADSFFCILWTLLYIKIFVQKLRLSEIQGQSSANLADPGLLIAALLAFKYFSLGTLSLVLLCKEFLSDYGVYLILAFIVYGFLSESSPNCFLIAVLIIFFIFMAEAIVRIVTCDLKTMCPTSEAVSYTHLTLPTICSV